MTSAKNINREVLKENYKREFIFSARNDEKCWQECVEWLTCVDIHNCFKLLPFEDIMKVYTDKEIGKLDDVMDALKNLEKYAQNLLKKPWCKDCYTIKVFNGFFKYNIEKWIPLKVACHVLKLMGYHNEGHNEGIFGVNEVNEDKVLSVGFELRLAHTQIFVVKDCEILKKYKVGDILDAWHKTTGDPGKIYQLLCEMQPGKLFTSDSMCEPTKRNGITTSTMQEHFDQNGIATFQELSVGNKQIPSSFSFSDGEKSMPSLLSSQISDDQMYSRDDIDETGVVTESMKNVMQSSLVYEQRFSGSKYYNQGNVSNSLPTISNLNFKKQKSNSDHKSSILYSYKDKESLKNISQKDLFGDEDGTNGSKAEHMANNKGNHFSVVNNSRLNTTEKNKTFCRVSSQEKLEKDAKKIKNMLKARVEAGEKDLQQRSIDSSDFETDGATNETQQCSICGSHAVSFCEICEQLSCKECLKILKRKNCLPGNAHKCCKITNFPEHDFGHLSLTQVNGKTKENLSSTADLNKWKCSHCTFLNSCGTEICESCHRTKGFEVTSPEPGSWQCTSCEYANKEYSSFCEMCEEKKGKLCSTIV